MNNSFPSSSALNVWRPVALVVGVLLAGEPVKAAGKVTARTGTLEIPTYGWAANGHPYFRGTDKVNIYPYPMLDFLSREKTNRTYQTVLLENEFLRITFLPELGGKIHEVIDKTRNKPMFYVNHVIKPGLIGQCGAWTSGGVEWNTGPQGHTVGCMQPVAVEILPKAKDGSQSVAIGETERIYGTHWTVVVTLRPGRSFIEERIRIYNPTQTVRPYYFWNCTASPNTPGFRFIYPMTLGCDHAGETFFKWPVDNGKDLTRGVSYQDASSIFAWHCDQNFFGSYNDDLDAGVVAFANHHFVPGKKAWTWGQGGFGKMHQMDLTDDDGPYNEVQTGPLLTQAQVGRLEPSEAVEWQEWWYPIHTIGGFTFANRELAANAVYTGPSSNKLELRIMGTATWPQAQVVVSTKAGAVLSRSVCSLSPNQPAFVQVSVAEPGIHTVEVTAKGGDKLARFDVPLQIPLRTPPAKTSPPATVSEITRSGWEDYLFAKYTDAESKFKQALEKDPKTATARVGLALLSLQADQAKAEREAQLAIEANPDLGLAHLALASASTNCTQAIAHALKASLDPATAVAGRNFAAKLLLSECRWAEVVRLLSENGPWQTDPMCQNYLALAQFKSGQKEVALELVKKTLRIDPLDSFALAVGWLAGDRETACSLEKLLGSDLLRTLDLVTEFAELKQPEIALAVLESTYLSATAPEKIDPLAAYWEHDLAAQTGKQVSKPLLSPQTGGEAVYPHQPATLEMLRCVTAKNPTDALATLYRGQVAFHLGKKEEALACWKEASKSAQYRSVACRSLGMAAKNLDNDLTGARTWLEQANQAAPGDAIIGRDLAQVLFSLADKATTENEKNDLIASAVQKLQGAFGAGKCRSDYVALLARAQNRRGEFAATAKLLDQVRVTVWEGAHEVHDLFEQAHLELGDSLLKNGKAKQALAEYDRALEYPENLATGKLENAPEAHIHLRRGKALRALDRTAEAKAAWTRAAGEPESKDPKQEAARQEAAKLAAQL